MLGKRLEVESQRVFSVPHCPFIGSAPGLAPRKSRKMREVAVFVALDSKGKCPLLCHATIVAQRTKTRTRAIS